MRPERSAVSFEQHLDYGTRPGDGDGAVQQRLAVLLEVNAGIARERAVYRTDRDRMEAMLMANPIDSSKAFSYFGLMMGTMPPITLAIRSIADGNAGEAIEVFFVVLLILAGLLAGAVGNVSGQLIPAAINAFRDFRAPNRIVMLGLIGFAWGATAGAAGGILLFVFGAIFAGFAGGVVGAICVPIFSILHDRLRRGDLIELKHFLPIGFGITLSLCAFILGI